MRVAAPSWPMACANSGTICYSQGGLYVWMHAPAGRSGEEVADDLLDKAGVAVLPGTCFGNVGAQYVRLSLLQPDERLAEAVKRIGTCCC